MTDEKPAVHKLPIPSSFFPKVAPIWLDQYIKRPTFPRVVPGLQFSNSNNAALVQSLSAFTGGRSAFTTAARRAACFSSIGAVFAAVVHIPSDGHAHKVADGHSPRRFYSVLNSLGLYNKNAKILFLVRSPPPLAPLSADCRRRVRGSADHCPSCGRVSTMLARQRSCIC